MAKLILDFRVTILWGNWRIWRNGKKPNTGDQIEIIRRERLCKRQGHSHCINYCLLISSQIRNRSMAYSGHNIEYLIVGFHLNFLHISLFFTCTPQIQKICMRQDGFRHKKMQAKQNQNHLELWDILWYDWRKNYLQSGFIPYCLCDCE